MPHRDDLSLNLATLIFVDWSAVAGVAAVASALVAAQQIWLSRRDANRRAALEHMRTIDERIRPLIRHSHDDLERAVLDAYKGQPNDSDVCADYMALLNALDLAAFAVDERLVARKLLEEYLGTIMRSGTVTLTFIDAFQACCGDSTAYHHLRKFLLDVRTHDRDREIPCGS